jgi:hypothetical protein
MSDSSSSSHPPYSPTIEPVLGGGPSPTPVPPVLRRTVKKFIIAVLAGVICFAVLPRSLDSATRSVAAWDLGVLVLVTEALFVILRSDPQRARERAVA